MFITAELWDAIVDHKLTPAITAKGGAKLYVGVDIGIKNDGTGIVAVKKVKAADGTNRIVLVHHKIFTPGPAPRWTMLISPPISGGCTDRCWGRDSSASIRARRSR